MNDTAVSRTFAVDKNIVKVQIDPKEETADVDTTNNVWPKQDTKSKFD